TNDSSSNIQNSYSRTPKSNVPVSSAKLLAKIKVYQSTPTPVALRTRSQLEHSFTDAAKIGLCKLCQASFASTLLLKKHLVTHKPDKKRKKALQAINDLSLPNMETPVTSTKKSLLQVDISKKFSPPGSVVTRSSPLITSSSIQMEVVDAIKDMIEATCQSSPSPKISADKSSPSVTYAHDFQCPSPMGSPDAYLLRLGSPNANDCPGKISPTILLHSNLILQQLPTILSPIPSPDPSSPNILEFILDKQETLSDCSPEAPPASIPKKPQIQSPLPQDKSPITFITTQDKPPIQNPLPQDKSPITFTATQDKPPKNSSPPQDKPT
ncbi:hypothetical protein NPIL_506191, partial [Nephila pilipes]